jgi:hypothetical protein
LPDLSVVRHDDAAIGIIAAKDHVVAGLPTKYEAGALQSPAYFPTG